MISNWVFCGSFRGEYKAVSSLAYLLLWIQLAVSHLCEREGSRKSVKKKMTTRFSVAVKEKQKQPVWMPWVQCSGSASLVQLGWGRAFFPSRRHCNQIYGCSSALPQHDAVVCSSACSSWKQAEGEQLTRAGRGCSLEGAFFPLKPGATCEIPAAAEERASWGFKLILGWREEVQTLGLTASDGKTAPDRQAALLKARLRHPSGKHSNCAYGTSAVVLRMPQPTRRNLPACGME